MNKLSKILSLTVVIAFVISTVLFSGCSCKVRTKDDTQQNTTPQDTTKPGDDSVKNVVILGNFVRIFNELANVDPECADEDYATFKNSEMVKLISIPLGVLNTYKKLGDVWSIHKYENETQILWGYIKLDFEDELYVCNIVRTFGKKDGSEDILYRYVFDYNYDTMLWLKVIGYSIKTIEPDYYRRYIYFDSGYDIDDEERWIEENIERGQEYVMQGYINEIRNAQVVGNAVLT